MIIFTYSPKLKIFPRKILIPHLISITNNILQHKLPQALPSLHCLKQQKFFEIDFCSIE